MGEFVDPIEEEINHHDGFITKNNVSPEIPKDIEQIDLRGRLDLYKTRYLKTTSLEEERQLKQEISQDSELINYGMTFFKKNPLEALGHIGDIHKHHNELKKEIDPSLIKRLKTYKEFTDFDFDNCSKNTGEYFDALISPTCDYVIKILRTKKGTNYQELKKMVLDGNQLNKKYFSNFLPNEEIFEKDGILFIKAEKIVGEIEEHIDLETKMTGDLSNIKELLENESFRKQFREFVDNAILFNNEAKNIYGNGNLLPDLAGRNLKIIFNRFKEFQRLVYIDTNGYMERSKNNCPIFDLIKEYIDRFNELLEQSY